MENKPKQTAVDYLFLRMEVLRGLFLFEEIDYKEYVDQKKDALQKAKQMEREQIIKAHKEGNKHNGWALRHEHEQYYKETYEKTSNN